MFLVCFEILATVTKSIVMILIDGLKILSSDCSHREDGHSSSSKGENSIVDNACTMRAIGISHDDCLPLCAVYSFLHL